MKYYLVITFFLTYFSVYGQNRSFDDMNKTKSKADIPYIGTDDDNMMTPCEYFKHIDTKVYKQCLRQKHFQK